MFDNPASGSNVQDLVQQIKDNREANKPDPVDSETTGGTEEAQPQAVETQSEADNFELEAEQDGVQESTEQEGDEAPRYTVKIGGEEKEVSLDELQSGYMMHSDYTRKTMSHAETVKEFEASKAAFDQERQAKLQELESFIEQQDQAIDWDGLRDTNPEEYIRLQELQTQRKDAAAKERAELEAKLVEQHQAKISQESAKLIDLMGPTWVGDKRVKDLNDMSEYLQSMGVSDQEITQLADARLMMVAMDAMRYRQMQDTKERVSKEVKEAPKSVKPGQTRRTETDVDKARAALQGASKFNQDQAAVNLMKARRGKAK